MEENHPPKERRNNSDDPMANFPFEISSGMILTRLDRLELCRLRFMSTFYRRIASSRELVERFNRRAGVLRSSWTFVWSRIRQEDNMGVVYGFREDGARIVMDLNDRRIMESLMEFGAGGITLMSSAGNFLCFRVQLLNQRQLCLLVLDICSFAVRVVDCPTLLLPVADETNSCQNCHMVLSELDFHHYMVVFVEQSHGVVRYFQYDSFWDQWSHFGTIARHVQDLMLVSYLMDRRNAVMVHEPAMRVYMVCMGTMGHVFTNHSIQSLMRNLDIEHRNVEMVTIVPRHPSDWTREISRFLPKT